MTLAGFVSNSEPRTIMGLASDVVFPAEEDFDTTPVEVHSEGTRVSAFGRGGMRQTIVVDVADPTRIFFDEPIPVEIAAAIVRFFDREHAFSPSLCRTNAACFAESHFELNFTAFVNGNVTTFETNLRNCRTSYVHSAPYLAKVAA